MARCRDLLSIPSLKNLKLLGGEAGLSRPMTWVYSILSQPFSNWVNFGDLILYNAAGRDTSEVMLLRAVSEADDCGLAGIIFLLDQDLLPSLPDSVGQRGDDLSLPVFTLAITENINNITRDIITYIIKSDNEVHRETAFWQALLFDPASQGHKALLTKAYLSGINPRQHYSLYLIQFCNLSDYFQLPIQQKQVEEPTAILSGFYSKVRSQLGNQLHSFWLVEHEESCVVILPVSQDAQVLNEPAFFVSIAQALEKQYDGARIRVSKGSVITSLEQTPRALMEAQRAIYIENLYPEALPYIDYSHLGFQRLLYEISDIELLRRYVADTIGPLLNYDSEHGTDYYGTLLSYYRMIRNVAKTAALLNYHRNSMILRLRKIQAILQLDLDSVADFYNVYVALEIEEYLRKLQALNSI